MFAWIKSVLEKTDAYKNRQELVMFCSVFSARTGYRGEDQRDHKHIQTPKTMVENTPAILKITAGCSNNKLPG